MRAHPKRKKIFLAGSVLFCVVVFVSLIVITEFYLVPKVLGYPRDVILLRHIVPPDANIDGQLINSMGLTGDVIAPDKPKDSIRILILGGSVMFNRHLGERLKISLQKNTHREIELVNAGIRSHSSRSDLYKMQRMALYSFDYVIYYNGINDLLMNTKSPMGYREDYSHYGFWYRQGFLLNHSVIAFFIYKVYWDMYNSYFGSAAEAGEINYYNYRSIDSFRNNIREILRLTKERGGTPVLMTFAYAIPENYSQQAFNQDELGYVNPEHYDRRPVEEWGTPDYVRHGLDRVNMTLRELASADSVALIDTDKQLTGHISLFGDVCHFNDAGVDVFVRIVTDRFIQEGWLH